MNLQNTFLEVQNMNNSLKAQSGEILSGNSSLQTALLARGAQKQLNQIAQVQAIKTIAAQMKIQGKYKALDTAMMGAANAYNLMNSLATLNPQATPVLNLMIERTAFSVLNDLDDL
jgi:hypothetical protein